MYVLHDSTRFCPAVLADPKGLWWGAVVTEAARRSRSGLEARTLLVRHGTSSGTDAYSPA